jgi:hypothetical protein
MEWCLSCHRQPQDFVRPRDKVFELTSASTAQQAQVGPELAQKHDIHTTQLTNCSVCHY